MATPASSVALGSDLNGYCERPRAGGRVPAVVVLMEAYGITAHIRNVCLRLAQAGYLALAPDFFRGTVLGYDERERVLALLPTLRDGDLLEDLDRARAWLGAQEEVDPERIAVLGFCMGGRLAYLGGCARPEAWRAVLALYGGGIAPEGPDRFGREPPIGRSKALAAPLFLGYGADDASIPPAEHARIAEILSGLGKRYLLAVYPGAGHGFLCEERPSHHPRASQDAWRDILSFLANTLA